MNEEAMKLALEAITTYLSESPDPSEEAVEGLCDARALLRRALAEPQEKYIYGTPLLDAMTGKINEALDKKAENARELGLDYEPAQQAPVALKWQRAPIRTAWGDEMVVASVAIDKDHTVCLYCERDQTPKVDAMFAQRTWVGLTDEEIARVVSLAGFAPDWAEAHIATQIVRVLEAKLKEKNT